MIISIRAFNKLSGVIACSLKTTKLVSKKAFIESKKVEIFIFDVAKASFVLFNLFFASWAKASFKYLYSFISRIIEFKNLYSFR